MRPFSTCGPTCGLNPELARGLTLALALLLAPLSGSHLQGQSSEGPQPMTMEASLLLPSWGSYGLSPDNRRVVFTRSQRDPENDWESTSHIWVHDIASGESRQLTNGARGESNPRWLNATEVLFNARRGEGDEATNRLWKISVTGGEAIPFFDDPEAPSGGAFTDGFSKIAFTEESDRVDQEEWEARREKGDDAYYAEHKLTWSHIWVYDAETGEKHQVTEGEYDHGGAAWSPDQQWIAFSSNRTQTQMGDPDRSDNSDVMVISAAGGEPIPVSNAPGPEGSATWAPSGAYIAWTGSLNENISAGQNDLFIAGFSNGQPTEPMNLTEDFDYSVSGPQWSPDGDYILFTAAQGLTSLVYRIPALGGEMELVLPDDEYIYGGVELSKDGTRLLFTGSSLTRNGEVFLANADGSNARRIMDPMEGFADFQIADARTLTWEGADGWEIEGILTYPIDYVEGERYPLILQVHGGPHGRFSKSFNTGTQIWAARGYAVLRTNPRGSSGRTLEFSNANFMDWGGKDFEDIMAGVDEVIEMGVADPERMSIMGGSYGGFMTFWAITQTERFTAAIGHAAISDWYSFYGQTDIPYYLSNSFGGMPWQTKETWEAYSPIEFAENVTTPLLITHGEEDRRVPIAQGEQYFRTLKKMGNTVEFLRFPREGHGIGEPLHRIFLDREQAEWFRKHVLERRPIT